MAAGSYLGLCFRAQALDLKVKIAVETIADPAQPVSRLSRLWVENKAGEEQGMAFIFPERDDLDTAADLVLEQLKRPAT